MTQKEKWALEDTGVWWDGNKKFPANRLNDAIVARWLAGFDFALEKLEKKDFGSEEAKDD